MPGLSVIHPPSGEFSVLLDNGSGAWKIVEGMHSLDALLPLATGMGAGQDGRGYRVITVFLNNTCNLRCDYCRFDPVTHHAIEHGTRDLDAVVDSVLALCRPGETVEIYFQGGEPLLRARDMRYVCETLAAAATGFGVRFHVTTNGTVCTERILDFLEQFGFEVTLSIDGLAETHDAHRPFADGRGSHAEALHTLARLRARGIPSGVFCVVADPRTMERTHDYFSEVLGLRTFVLAPLEIDGEGTAAAVQEYLQAFFDAQLRLLERNIDRYIESGVRVSEYLGELLLRGKAMPSFYSKACGDSPRSSCGTRMHSVERNGDVLPCQNARMNAAEGTEYLEGCLSRKGICERCEIRGHCSTPICFSRLQPRLVRGFDAGDPACIDYIGAACSQLKRRELALFDLFYRRKQDVLAYLTA